MQARGVTDPSQNRSVHLPGLQPLRRGTFPSRETGPALPDPVAELPDLEQAEGRAPACCSLSARAWVRARGGRVPAVPVLEGRPLQFGALLSKAARGGAFCAPVRPFPVNAYPGVPGETGV